MLDVLKVMQQKQMRVAVGIWTAKIGDQVGIWTAKIANEGEFDAAKTDETVGIWTAKIGDQVELESSNHQMKVMQEKQVVDVLKVMQQKQMRLLVYGQPKLLIKLNLNHQMKIIQQK
eukprot:5585_1